MRHWVNKGRKGKSREMRLLLRDYVLILANGHGQIQFQPGKAGIPVQSLDKLPGTIDTLITAVRAGELDAQMAALSDAIRKKITSKKAA
jgi:hypothetical protein